MQAIRIRERTCTVVLDGIDKDPVDEAATVAEQRHPEVLPERRQLIEQLRVAETPLNVYVLLAASQSVFII